LNVGSVIVEPVGSGLSRETPSDKGVISAMKDARRKLALYKCREIIEATAIWQDEDGKDDHQPQSSLGSQMMHIIAVL
jgi:hypothetical protein